MSYVEVRGHRAHVQRMGSGDRVVVFVHGMLMDNMASWFFTVAPAVSKRARVIMYDLRGHGRSERTETGYAIPDLVADLDAVLDALDVDRPVVVVGNSFGGLLALEYTLTHPERVEGLVLVDGNMHDEQWNRDIAERFRRSAEDPGTRKAEAWRYAYRYMGLESQRKRNNLGRNADRLVRKTTFVDDVSSSRPFGPEELRTVEVPVLAMYGSNSELAERARSMIGELPRCESVWFDGDSHLLLWERSREVEERILDWLDRLD